MNACWVLVDNVYKKYFEVLKVNSPSAAGTEKKIAESERNLEK